MNARKKSGFSHDNWRLDGWTLRRQMERRGEESVREKDHEMMTVAVQCEKTVTKLDDDEALLSKQPRSPLELCRF